MTRVRRALNVKTIDKARIVLAVTGGIAAYKAADLASKLVQAGAAVDVILTDAATRFVGPATFEALTKHAVHSDVLAPWTERWHGHITLAHEADLLVVAPATANTIAKLAHGLADDMLGAVALSTRAPLLLAPAMEHDMLHHPATQANLLTLKQRGAWQIGPEAGRHASGKSGDGRMSAPETILSAIRYVLGRGGPLASKHVVISAGGTREALDPVRYLGNRSSGRMGYALAEAAIAFGADVTIVTSVGLPAPYGAQVVAVESARDMQLALSDAVKSADVLIMAAAVADFRPAETQSGKIKKQPGQETLEISLIRNPDILASLDRPGLLKVGFAAETEDLLANATQKLQAKGLAMIVANDAAATIGSTESAAHLLFADSDSVALPLLPKEAVAFEILRQVARLASGAR